MSSFLVCLITDTLHMQTEDESETESEDDEDSGVRRGEPNKFDGLCDGLLNAMALVHCALKDVSHIEWTLHRHHQPFIYLVYGVSLDWQHRGIIACSSERTKILVSVLFSEEKIDLFYSCWLFDENSYNNFY